MLVDRLTLTPSCVFHSLQVPPLALLGKVPGALAPRDYDKHKGRALHNFLTASGTGRSSASRRSGHTGRSHDSQQRSQQGSRVGIAHTINSLQSGGMGGNRARSEGTLECSQGKAKGRTGLVFCYGSLLLSITLFRLSFQIACLDQLCVG